MQVPLAIIQASRNANIESHSDMPLQEPRQSAIPRAALIDNQPTTIRIPIDQPSTMSTTQHQTPTQPPRPSPEPHPSASTETTPPPQPRQHPARTPRPPLNQITLPQTIDPTLYYRLHTTHATFALDTVSDPQGLRDGTIHLSLVGPYSGQRWLFTPLPPSPHHSSPNYQTYRLTNTHLGPSRSLDVMRSDRTCPRMASSGNYSGQQWVVELWDDGRSWKLWNMFSGPGLCLGNGLGRGNEVQMVAAHEGGRDGGIRWHFTPVGYVGEDEEEEAREED